MRLPEPPLLVVTDRRQAARPLEEIAAAAFAGGCRWLGLREKDLPAAEQAALLERLMALAKPWQAVVTVYADPSLARDAGVASVHLPRNGAPRGARAMLGPAALVGVSAHDEAEVARAAAEGADYVTLSPIFASASKPGYGPALGLEALARIAGKAAVPVVALGGIGPDEAADCIAAGAAGVAVMGALMRADDPLRMTAMLVEAVSRSCRVPDRTP